MTEQTNTPAPEANENTLVFTIPHTETNVQIDLTQIPAELRMDLLKKAVEGYVRNSVNQTHVRFNKSREPWVAYAEAMKADPMQTAVAKPEGEEPTEEQHLTELLDTAKAARERLYKNEVRKQGTGGGTRAKADPLTSMVTQAVVRELFEKKKATDSKYKWTDAVKEVGGDGIKYLDAKIEEMVANGADRAELEKFKESRYIQPAKLMLGQRDTATTKGTSLL